MKTPPLFFAFALLIVGSMNASAAEAIFDALLPPTVQLASRWQIAGAEQQELLPPASPARAGESYRLVRDVTVEIALPEGLLPEAKQVDESARLATPLVDDLRRYGEWPKRVVHWAPSCSVHRPLYFEEVNLERHGYTRSHCLQPVLSGAHFFAAVPALPYKMAAQCPRECVYTLGHYRPGSCVPWRPVWPPCECKAAAAQAGVAVGLIFLIP